MQLGHQDDSSKVSSTEITSIFYLNKAKNKVEAEQVEFDLGQIANVMQTAHF